MAQQQIGGRSVYSFLNTPPSARIAGQGSNAIANLENDINFALMNPSLLREDMSGQFSTSIVDFQSDILLGDIAYAQHFDSIGTFTASLRVMDYGDFDRTTTLGINQGTFTAADYFFGVGYGNQIDSNWSYGANLKGIYSAYDTYTSSAIALDLGATYTFSEGRSALALLVKNVGFQFDPYAEERESLPFEIQLGISNRFKYLPLRWQITAEQLETFDLRYDNPTKTQVNGFTGEVDNNYPNMLNNILQHFVFGAEFAPTPGFNLQFGYSFRKRQDLNLDTRRTSAGFSFGVGFKISKFRVNYARNMTHVAGSANQFSLTTDFQDFKKKKRDPAED